MVPPVLIHFRLGFSMIFHDFPWFSMVCRWIFPWLFPWKNPSSYKGAFRAIFIQVMELMARSSVWGRFFKIIF
jgi:hypothetical protein